MATELKDLKQSQKQLPAQNNDFYEQAVVRVNSESLITTTGD